MEKIRIFNQATLVQLLRDWRKSTGDSYRTMAEKSGLSYESIRSWEQEKTKTITGGMQDNLYKLLGDNLFTHGLDMVALKKRIASEYERCSNYNALAGALDMNIFTFYDWRWRDHLPYMNWHEQIYAAYGRTVFKRMHKIHFDQASGSHEIGDSPWKQ